MEVRLSPEAGAWRFVGRPIVPGAMKLNRVFGFIRPKTRKSGPQDAPGGSHHEQPATVINSEISAVAAERNVRRQRCLEPGTLRVTVASETYAIEA
jgi:hypothetical protein